MLISRSPTSGDLSRRHTAIQPALGAAFDLQLYQLALQLGCRGLRLRQSFRFPGILGGPLLLDLLQRPRLRLHGQLLGEQEIPGVSVADVQDLVPLSDILDILQ